MDEMLISLLRAHGYKYHCGILITIGIKGEKCSDFIGTFETPLAAAEYVCPNIPGDEFGNVLLRYKKRDASE